MACVKPDGTLTELGRQGLTALAEQATEEAASTASGLPLYRVRMLARALVEEGLLEKGEGGFALTAFGREKLDAEG